VALDETAIDDVSCPHSTCSSPDTLEAHGKAVHASHHTKSGANTTEADDGHPVKQTARAVTPPSLGRAERKFNRQRNLQGQQRFRAKKVEHLNGQSRNVKNRKE
jgi:hypothetical protein